MQRFTGAAFSERDLPLDFHPAATGGGWLHENDKDGPVAISGGAHDAAQLLGRLERSGGAPGPVRYSIRLSSRQIMWILTTLLVLETVVFQTLSIRRSADKESLRRGRRWAPLHESADGLRFPTPGRTYPTRRFLTPGGTLS